MPSGVVFTTSAWSAKRRDPEIPIDDPQPGQIAGQSLGPCTRAVRHGHSRPCILQRRGNGARRTASTEQQRRTGRRIHTMGAKIGDEPLAVRVAAGDPAVVKH